MERVMYRRYFKVLTDYEPPGKTAPWKNIYRALAEKNREFSGESDAEADVIASEGAFGFVPKLVGIGGGGGRRNTPDVVRGNANDGGGGSSVSGSTGSGSRSRLEGTNKGNPEDDYILSVLARVLPRL